MAASTVSAQAQTSGPVAAALDAVAGLDAAAAALQAAESEPDRVAALTAVVLAYERGLAALREAQRRAITREGTIEAALAERSEELSQLLSALQAVESPTIPVRLLHPAGPLGTARAAILMSDLVPGLETRAAQVRGEVEELTALTDTRTQAEARLTTGLAEVRAARTALTDAARSRQDLPLRLADDPEALARLANSSATLEAFALGLTENAPPELAAAAPPGSFVDALGALNPPVNGAILRRFQSADAAGIARPGIVMATRPGALVQAPVQMSVRYAGTLLDYGNVIIAEPGPGYLLVLTGLGEILGAPGQVLPPGAPLGLMGGTQNDSGTDAAAPNRADELTQTLYIETRVNQKTVDPATWFALDKE